MQHLIANAANTSTITVIVHPTVYAKLTDSSQTDWYAVNTAAQGQGSSSGGGVRNDPTTPNAVEPEKLERKAPETNISVIVQGDVFDSEGTGLRIADIINTQFSQNGVKIVGVT